MDVTTASADTFRDYFTLMARYNQWANRRLYTAVGALPEVERHLRRPTFFGSIMATLNHVLVGDKAWMARLTGTESGVTALDQILYEDFEELRAAREAMDARIIETVPTLPVMGELSYRTMAGQPQKTPWTVVLGHLFNHQTHHRGQVHDMLSQTKVDPPPLDLIYFVREQGG